MASTPFPARRYGAELVGTFLLTMAVAASGALPTPLTAGLTLMVLVYLLGPVSGAHINPAVTLGLYTLRKISFRHALGYIIAQLLGAFIASLLLAQMIELVTAPPISGTEGSIAELLGTFVLAFAVARVVLGHVTADTAGLTIGLALLLGITVASIGSLGVINPAVSLGLGLFDPATPGFGVNLVVYLLAPLVGGFLGAQACEWFSKKKD